MPSGYVAPEKRCVGFNKNGKRCGNAGIVFTDPPRCRFHNGHNRGVLAKAEERAHQYELGMLDPLDPPEVRRMKLRAWGAKQNNMATRQMKKAGIYEDWQRQAEQMQKEAREAELLERLGPEKVAKLKKEAKEVRDWMMSGGKGPRPGSAEFWGEEPEPSSTSDGEDDERPKVFMQYSVEDGHVPTEPELGPEEQRLDGQHTEPEPQPDPEVRRKMARQRKHVADLKEEARRAEAEYEAFRRKGATSFAQHPVNLDRLRRRAIRARRKADNPPPLPDRLPEDGEGHGGGVICEDVLPVDARDWEARQPPGVIYPPGVEYSDPRTWF